MRGTSNTCAYGVRVRIRVRVSVSVSVSMCVSMCLCLCVRVCLRARINHKFYARHIDAFAGVPVERMCSIRARTSFISARMSFSPRMSFSFVDWSCVWMRGTRSTSANGLGLENAMFLMRWSS